MNKHIINKTALLSILGFLLFTVHLSAQSFEIIGFLPGINQNHVNRESNITVEFNLNVDEAAFHDSTIIIRSNQRGILNGSFSGLGSKEVTFNPDKNFNPGEVVSVTVNKNLKSEGGLSLLRGHTYSFTVASGTAPQKPLTFASRASAGARSAGKDVRAMDYDGDGYMDMLAGYDPGISEEIWLYQNDGDMNFCPVNLGGNFRNLEVFDIDNDGDFDNFGWTGAFDTKLSWFENEGDPPHTERVISAEDPWTLAGGDLDSDGDIDVIALVLIPTRLLWFANDGHGNFSAPKSIPTSNNGSSESDSYFYIRDINSDGAMDILAFHKTDQNIVWYENDGNQNFTEHFILNTPNRMRLASADIDDDGDMDFVAVSTTNATDSTMLWFENNEENFTEHLISTSNSNALFTVNITDLDGDQDMDILAGGYWFENDGSENFTEQIISEGLKSGTNYYATGINYADMDGDGDMDVVSLYSSVSWHENILPMQVTSVTPGNADQNVGINDNISITFDQPIDISSVNSNNISVLNKYRGWTSGSFSGGGTNTIGFDPNDSFYPGDIIEVSISEKVKSTNGHSLAATFGFSFQVQTQSGAPPVFSAHSVKIHKNNATGMDIADVDGDGDLDLVSCSWFELYWHKNDGNGNFTPIPIDTIGTHVGVFAFDQNGDGFTDIWVDHDGSASSTVYINDGNQNFTEATATGNISLKQAIDLNHNGDIDLIYIVRSNGRLGMAGYSCERYNGIGSTPNILNNNDVQAGDIDNDGDTDLISASSDGPVYFINGGYNNFKDQSFDDNNTKNVFLSDLDNDGDLDAIFTESYSAIIWYKNMQDGDSSYFGERQVIDSLDQDPRDVIAVDIDGDGDADIAAVSRNDDKVVWYENRLNEMTADFGPEQMGVSTADGPIQLLSADLDNDGDMDLVSLSENDDELTWFENSSITAIEKPENNKPLTYRLDQNYPNPFNNKTVISYKLKVKSDVELSIYNIIGQKVATLVKEQLSAGEYQFQWDAKNVSSGVYYYKLTTDGFVQTRKMLLLK